ncbi:MAG TPA: transporter substrate-binding domain-containing protein [Pseudoduganella sp.]
MHSKRLRLRSFATLLFALAIGRWAVAQEPVVVYYPPPYSDTDTRDVYTTRLLAMALEKSGGHFVARPAAGKMLQGRALLMLEQGRGIDVAWAATSKEIEAQVRPVRIPIFKGLIGYRLLLISRRDAEKFARIKEEGELKAQLAGQGHDWADTVILRANGYRVHSGSYYDALFKMLSQHRIDYYPRSVLEIWAEAKARQGDGLMVEPHLMLRYPSAVYFFTRKDNTALAQAIEVGLERMLHDGSFDKLFNEHHGELLAKASMGSRLVFDLENPDLPPATPLDRPTVWYRLP